MDTPPQRTASNRSVEEFLASMLEQACFLRCNPNARAQALAADGGEAGIALQDAAKRDCVQGCQLVTQRPVKAALRSSLIMRVDDELHHAEVLPAAEEQRIRTQTTALCERIEAACADECARHCAQTHAASADRRQRCAVSCAAGCSAFLDTLSR